MSRAYPLSRSVNFAGGVTGNSNRASRDVPAKYVIGDGDFLFSWSGSLLAKFWTGGAGALNQHLFKVTSDSYPAWFFSQWVWHHLAEFQAIAASKATTMGHIQRGHLSAAMTLTPPTATLAMMSNIIQPLLDRIIWQPARIPHSRRNPRRASPQADVRRTPRARCRGAGGMTGARVDGPMTSDAA